MNALVRLVLPGLLLAGSLGASPDPWTQLKTGMSTEAATALLGPPMLRTKGHGLETWIYENGAEVLIHGGVAGWTLPPEVLRPAPTPVIAPRSAPAKPVKPPVAAAPLQKPPANTKADDIRLLGSSGPTTPPPS